jgi:predicted ribosomally synthesized peptide with nif11-like leader
MSEEQLSALLEKLKEDKRLRESLKNVAGPDASMEIAKEAGFDISKEDWFRHQSRISVELGDEELEELAGGWAVTWSKGCKACVAASTNN